MGWHAGARALDLTCLRRLRPSLSAGALRQGIEGMHAWMSHGVGVHKMTVATVIAGQVKHMNNRRTTVEKWSLDEVQYKLLYTSYPHTTIASEHRQ